MGKIYLEFINKVLSHPVWLKQPESESPVCFQAFLSKLCSALLINLKGHHEKEFVLEGAE